MLRNWIRVVMLLSAMSAAMAIGRIASAATPLTPAQTPELIAKLASPDWILQCDAIEQLSAHRAADAARPITALIQSDASPFVRARALNGLRQLDPPAALRFALDHAASGDVTIRVASLEALGLLGDAAGKPATIAAVDDADPDVRRAAIVAYARLHGKAATQLVTNRLRSDDPQIASMAAAAIIHTDATAARRELIAALDRPEPTVRQAALLALGELRNPEAIAPVLARLAKDDDPATRDAALAAIEHFPAEALRTPVEQALRSDDALRQAAVRIISKDPDPAYKSALLTFLGDSSNANSPLLTDAIEALAQIGGDGVGPTFEHYATHADPQIRAAATLHLRPAESPGCWPILVDRLVDADAQVRSAAFAALRHADPRKGPGGVLGVLTRPAQSEDGGTSRLAMTLLRGYATKLDAQALFDALTPSLESADEGRRRLAVAILESADASSMGTKIAATQGYISAWMVICPFAGGDETAALNQAMPPEQKIDFSATYAWKSGDADAPLTWLPVSVGSQGVVGFEAGERPTQGAIGYAVADVKSAADQDVMIDLFVDDAMRIWINGQPVGDTLRGHARAPAKLKAGVNRVVAKVYNISGPWYMLLRLTDPSGRRAPGVEVLPLP